jgi:hypothetical protein
MGRRQGATNFGFGQGKFLENRANPGSGDRQLPEMTIANESFREVGFHNASHVEVFSEVFSMGTDG